ncbi:hypothetical protein D9Q98_000210 [Chlorella vulgaris]|uniref:Sphingomyelin synthase-like domain-containing protein n=1 Tax=Chlorella vulgaris TaxID=3077 RepID=A0A9D4TXS5_CHLVU|nr:hypothetical protein D9Q98_000210 [Chlorella vulgaris]
MQCLPLERCSSCPSSTRDRLCELWRRIRLEFTIELPMLLARWKQVLFGAIFQYVHAIFTQLAHRMHQPQAEPLGDIGFRYMPELGLQNAWVSESIFWCLFIPFIIWSFSPFVTARKRFYTAVLYARLLMVLVTCQILRIISFTVTQLPAPNYHCRLGEETAVREMPEHWWGHVVVDLGRQATHGCGDLVFSSHTTFVLTGVLTFTEYGETLLIKIIAWIGVVFMGLCIVASRKHYSVDVVVAFYTVPLVFYTMHRRWTTKRPVQDYWPHRPLLGEEEVELAELGDIESGDADGGKMDVTKQPLLPPLLPVVQQGRASAQHSRSGSRTQAELKSGGASMGNLSSAGTPAAEEQRGGAGGSSNVRQARPRSITVMAAPSPESPYNDREDSPTNREARQPSNGSAGAAQSKQQPKQRIT